MKQIQYTCRYRSESHTGQYREIDCNSGDTDEAIRLYIYIHRSNTDLSKKKTNTDLSD